MMTQSPGVPSTVYVGHFMFCGVSIFSTVKGLNKVMEAPLPLWSLSGTTTVRSAIFSKDLAIAHSPGECIPSSFVSNTRMKTTLLKLPFYRTIADIIKPESDKKLSLF